MATLTDSGQGMDIAIGGLGFKIAANPERPYERATAQFRKEQFDSTPTVGDQSLTGWWTRGQLSFHKGEGVTYYEVLDGEEVFNRYKSGSGVDPFTTAGEVAVTKDWQTSASTYSFSGVFFGGSNPMVNVWAHTTDFLVYNSDPAAAPTTYSATGTYRVSKVAPAADAIYLAVYDSLGPDYQIRKLIFTSGGTLSTDTLLYTGNDRPDGLFYAKDRLWLVDSSRKWYQLDPSPAASRAIAESDRVLTGGPTDSAYEWNLIDTPGPVLIANGRRIYAITLNSEGAVPTLSGPVQVAELPPGEEINGFLFHLGYLVINTSKGVRVAVASNGAVIYGPLTIKWSNTNNLMTTLAAFGNSVYTAGGNGTGSTLSVYRIDLSQQIGETLTFGYATLASPFTGTPTQWGCFTTKDYRLDVWWSTGAKHEHATDYQTTSNVLTGYHRFGTLEPKHYEDVKVRVGGTGGTIAVARVDADGTTTTLATLSPSTSVQTVPLSMTATAEMVALKFTFTRGSATTVPKLLGYQLRALPAPAPRHRMIRIPLLCYDQERRGPVPGAGYTGSAYDRLKALEDMESGGAVHDYQDFRTGETGRVFLESVEHKGVTPPGAKSNGYGGIVWVTLRKIS